MPTQLPKIGERVIEIDARRAGCLTPAFYRFLLDIYEAQAGGADVQAQIRAIAVALGSPDGTVANIPDLSFDSFLPKTARVEGNNSIFSQGTLAGGIVSLELENDEFAPLPTSYYGTDALGGKGWHTVFDALAEGVGIVLSADEFGVVSVALAELADTGAGALRAITRDVYGRVEGSRALTITGTDGQISVAHGTGADGDPTVALVEVPNSEGGEIQRTEFDSFGRATKRNPATTDNLDEGATALYFTAARAVDAIEDTGPDYLDLYTTTRDAP